MTRPRPALEAKAKAKAWTFEAKAKAKAIGSEAKAQAKAWKFGLEAPWGQGLASRTTSLVYIPFHIPDCMMSCMFHLAIFPLSELEQTADAIAELS